MKKALYGLKQARRACYTHLQHLGFKINLSESTLLIEIEDSGIVVLSLYVDDLLVTRNNLQLIEEFKEGMKKTFEMKDLGEMSFFLVMQIHQTQNEVFVSKRSMQGR